MAKDPIKQLQKLFNKRRAPARTTTKASKKGDLKENTPLKYSSVPAAKGRLQGTKSKLHSFSEEAAVKVKSALADIFPRGQPQNAAHPAAPASFKNRFDKQTVNDTKIPAAGRRTYHHDSQISAQSSTVSVTGATSILGTSLPGRLRDERMRVQTASVSTAGTTSTPGSDLSRRHLDSPMRAHFATVSTTGAISTSDPSLQGHSQDNHINTHSASVLTTGAVSTSGPGLQGHPQVDHLNAHPTSDLTTGTISILDAGLPGCSQDNHINTRSAPISTTGAISILNADLPGRPKENRINAHSTSDLATRTMLISGAGLPRYPQGERMHVQTTSDSASPVGIRREKDIWTPERLACLRSLEYTSINGQGAYGTMLPHGHPYFPQEEDMTLQTFPDDPSHFARFTHDVDLNTDTFWSNAMNNFSHWFSHHHNDINKTHYNSNINNTRNNNNNKRKLDGGQTTENDNDKVSKKKK
ncbi:hypothetical protein BGX23_010006 [Mortierella sp. AD031]|nr:hypothetical protein BGX23_010006 [Mortierella sp. AD031]